MLCYASRQLAGHEACKPTPYNPQHDAQPMMLARCFESQTCAAMRAGQDGGSMGKLLRSCSSTVSHLQCAGRWECGVICDAHTNCFIWTYFMSSCKT